MLIVVTGAEAKFQLGFLNITTNAMGILPVADMSDALNRHLRGDWGDVDEEDRASNDLALLEDTRLLSVYHTTAGIKFWIITEWDRSSTTILMPEDY